MMLHKLRSNFRTKNITSSTVGVYHPITMDEIMRYEDGGGAVLEFVTLQGATFTRLNKISVGHHIGSLGKIPFKENDILMTSYPKSGKSIFECLYWFWIQQ